MLTLTQHNVLSWNKETISCSEILACRYGSPDLAYQFGNEEEGTGREQTGRAVTLRLQLAALTVRLTVLVMERKGGAAASAKSLL